MGGTDGAWRGSAGVHDLKSGAAADPDARFRAGSTTKVVTAATVLRLAALGKVDLDTPVQHYLPGLLTKAFEPISVRQLFNHTSGIQAGDGFGDAFEDQYAHRFDTLTPRQVVASAVAKGPEFGPGQQQDYLNVNYTILGLLIEKVTGHSYASEATRLVLRPAGMRDTYFPAPTRASGARTTTATSWSNRPTVQRGSWTSPTGTRRTAGRRRHDLDDRRPGTPDHIPVPGPHRA